MYKLIIVDDEKVIRKGMRDYFDWASINFEVVATFEDGKEALDYIKDNEVDVILTDIEMAEVSGLSVAKYVHDNNLPQKVVIISGYKEFEYARKAVEYGVENYLLKPIRMEEVTEVFTKICKDLEKKGANSGENQPYAIVDFTILEKDTTFWEHYEGENYLNMVNNICGGETDDIQSFPLYISQEVVKIIFTTKRKEGTAEFERRVEAVLKEKCEMALQLLKLKIEMKVEKVFSNIKEIIQSQYVASKNSKDSKDSEGIKDSEGSKDSEDSKDTNISSIYEESMSIEKDKIEEITKGDIFEKSVNNTVVAKPTYQEIMKDISLDELKLIMKAKISDEIAIGKDKKNVGSKQFIDEAIKYMKENYGEDISLDTVASRYFLNQAYFSRLFKQYTGVTFTDYLIELRMEKAKELLNTGKYKVYEVSQKVGYRSEKYFFRIFKQNVGCSPTEYFRGQNINN